MAEPGLAVIGAGFGRTGTVSMMAALERLGFGPSHHMIEVFVHPELAGEWVAMVRGEPWDVERSLAGYRSTLDFPSCLAWRELSERFPDALVLLTMRSSDSWWRSFSATIGPSMRDPTTSDEPGIVALFEALSEVTFGGRSEDEESAVAVYEAHNAAVIAGVDPARLCVYEVGSGWEPLCAALGVPVPDEPFPHANTSEEFQARRAGDAADG